MLPQPCRLSHELRVGDPTIGSQDNRTTEGRPLHHLIRHPGQALELPPIDPVLMWAEGVPQRLRETMRAFQVDPP